MDDGDRQVNGAGASIRVCTGIVTCNLLILYSYKSIFNRHQPHIRGDDRKRYKYFVLWQLKYFVLT